MATRDNEHEGVATRDNEHEGVATRDNEHEGVATRDKAMGHATRSTTYLSQASCVIVSGFRAVRH